MTRRHAGAARRITLGGTRLAAPSSPATPAFLVPYDNNPATLERTKRPGRRSVDRRSLQRVPITIHHQNAAAQQPPPSSSRPPSPSPPSQSQPSGGSAAFTRPSPREPSPPAARARRDGQPTHLHPHSSTTSRRAPHTQGTPTVINHRHPPHVDRHQSWSYRHGATFGSSVSSAPGTVSDLTREG